jgi:hypothetical protein
MKGATAELFTRTINPPKRMRKITIGVSHHFFRTFKKFHISTIIDSLLIIFLFLEFFRGLPEGDRLEE